MHVAGQLPLALFRDDFFNHIPANNAFFHQEVTDTAMALWTVFVHGFFKGLTLYQTTLNQ